MKKNIRRRWLYFLLAAALSTSLFATSALALGENQKVIGTPTSPPEVSVHPNHSVQSDFPNEEISEPAFEENTEAETTETEVFSDSAFASNYNSLTKQFFCNYKGYRLSFPSDAVIDTKTGYDAKVTVGDCVMEITKEWSPYSSPANDLAAGIQQVIPDFKWSDGKDQYIGYYESRFLLNKVWQQNNNVTVSDVRQFQAAGYKGMSYSAVIANMPQGMQNGYTYLYLKLNSQWFLRIVARYNSSGSSPSDNAAQEANLKRILSTLYTYQPSGSKIKQTYRPERKAAWSEETQAFYNRLKQINTDNKPENQLLWGIYSQNMPTTGINEKIPRLEQQLDYTFQAVMTYNHFFTPFPTDFMNQAYNQGKVVEMTFQITDNNNEDLFARSLFLRLYKQDPEVIEVIRQFARDAKAFGHPFLFRPCNEMNSDWVSYGGVNNMADPDIFIENWRTMYRIFQEEGVDNCIWVYNPNDRNAPPDDWNDALNYYPGNEYVDVIGVTGYNNGTYYSQWREEWREFETIYDNIQNEYGQVFGQFPWMITEFSSSSVGGDKPAWILKMFEKIGKYKNIKLAVWFDYADYDAYGNVARPYWLDETKDTLRAFKSGLKGLPFFKDLGSVGWAYDSIYEVVDAGYFKGTSESTFEPSLSVSRAMVFTVIARMAGVDTTTTGPWYQPGLDWAVANGISDGTNPMSSITREQLVTMLYRWYQKNNPSDSIEVQELSDLANANPAAENSSFANLLNVPDYRIFLNYPDYSLIHDWARDAMKWALEEGIIRGNDFGQIEPQGTATRAQTAVIIQRFTNLQNQNN